MIDEELATRFIDGEVLAGKEATQIMGELYGFGAWRMYVIAAAAKLRAGDTERALELLETLLEAHNEEAFNEPESADPNGPGCRAADHPGSTAVGPGGAQANNAEHRP